MRAQIVLFDGFDLLDAVAPFEVLSLGGAMGGGQVHTELVSLEGARPVVSGVGGVTLRAGGAVDLERTDFLIVPGTAGEPFGDGPSSVPTRLNGALASGLGAVLGEAMARPDVTVATVCYGSLLLGMAGLLKGRHAVTHHLGMAQLAAAGARTVVARVVDDGDFVSAGGVTSGLDLGLYLLERELGPQIAHAVETIFEYERRGTVWRAQGTEPIAV